MIYLTEQANEPADFERAIESTGYGKFHYMLLLTAMPCCFASVFETTTMSLILPSAECDLKLSLVDKGMLNAITYAGELFGSFISFICRNTSSLHVQE
jgi:MFS transporter, VNT family, synaptic vesicle glycoprotein 2